MNGGPRKRALIYFCCSAHPLNQRVISCLSASVFSCVTVGRGFRAIVLLTWRTHDLHHLLQLRVAARFLGISAGFSGLSSQSWRRKHDRKCQHGLLHCTVTSALCGFFCSVLLEASAWAWPLWVGFPGRFGPTGQHRYIINPMLCSVAFAHFCLEHGDLLDS